MLDNLSTIVPDNLSFDQIKGDINIFPVSLSLCLPIFNFSNDVLVGDSFHTFHPVGGQGLNTCWRDVYVIYEIFKRDVFINKKSLKIFKYKYYFHRFVDVISTIIVTDILIKLFANKKFFLLPLRKISFLLLNKFILFRKFIINHMTKSLIYSSIK